MIAAPSAISRIASAAKPNTEERRPENTGSFRLEKQTQNGKQGSNNASQQISESDGLYVGEITLVSGTRIPIQVSFHQTLQATERMHSTDIMFSAQKIQVGSFVIGEEGGPYTFSLVGFDPESGEVMLKYSRLKGNNSTDAVEGNPTLWFEGRHFADGTMKGKLTSETRGYLGTFQWHKVANVGSLAVRPVTVGTWTGSWTYRDGTTDPFVLTLRDNENIENTPENWELAFSPGRVGSARIGVFEMPFAQVLIDDLGGRMVLKHENSSFGTSMTLIAKFSGDTVNGEGISTLTGQSGTFQAKRVDSSAVPK